MGPNALEPSEVAMISACQHKDNRRRNYTAVLLISPNFKAVYICIYILRWFLHAKALCLHALFLLIALALLTSNLNYPPTKGKKIFGLQLILSFLYVFVFFFHFNDFFGSAELIKVGRSFQCVV